MLRAERLRRNRESMQRLRDERRAVGLTDRGTPRKVARSRAGTPPVMRVLERVAIGEGCWTYPSKNRPMIGSPGQLAYRVVYEAFVGQIPDGLTLDHLCGNVRCVNPAHLDPVSRGENTSRYYRARAA